MKPRHAKSRQRHVRPQNAAQIRDDQERFGTLCEVSTDLIYELDSKGRYVYLSPSHETLGYERGALLGRQHSEFIHPEDRAAVNTDIRTSIDTTNSLRSLFRIRTNDGQWRWLDASGRPFSCALSQDTRLVLIARDITAQKTMEERLLFLASHDPLTSLYNGRGLVEALLEAIEEAKAGEPSALLLIDLDNFKVVNDVYEHATGDRLIVAIADLLHRTVAARGLLARPRGDEFVLLRSECVKNS
ncbi:MAG: diguanylate cyclase [Bryobacteraceae bacterium]